VQRCVVGLRSHSSISRAACGGHLLLLKTL
jgi:hypothetical protein